VPGSLFGDEEDAAEAGGNSGRQASRECLKCGESFQNLPQHMWHCDGGESDA